MKLGMQVVRGPCHIVLDEDPEPPTPKRGTAAPSFLPMSMAKRWPISAAAELLYDLEFGVVVYLVNVSE